MPWRRADRAEALHWLLAIAAFVPGAVISGFIVEQDVLQLGRRYGVVLVLESLLLFAAVPLLHAGETIWASTWRRWPAGCRTRMVSTYSGVMFRTTHVTGIFTDLGIYLGQRLRGLEVDPLRSTLPAGDCGFLAGAVVGTLLLRRHGQERTLLVPAALTGLAGLAYAIYLPSPDLAPRHSCTSRGRTGHADPVRQR